MAEPQRIQTITPDNYGGYITVASALLVVLVVFFYIFRLMVRFVALKGFFATDDIIITVATAFGVAQSVVTMIAVSHGIGKDVDIISPNKLQQAELIQYAADILYIFTVALGKISTCELVARLTRKREHLIASRAVAGIIAVWGVGSMFAIGLRCLPHPWDLLDRCSSFTSHWSGVLIVGCVLELALVLLPAYLVWSLQMPVKSKMIVIGAFSSRVLILPMAIARLSELYRIHSSNNYTFDVVNAIIFGQVEMHYTLIAASIPCMRPFLKAWNTGLLALDAGAIDRALAPGYGSHDSYALNSRSSIGEIKQKENSVVSSRTKPPTIAPHRPRAATEATTGTAPRIPSPTVDPRKEFVPHAVTTIGHGAHAGDTVSISSEGSEKMIIRKTVGYTVRYSTSGH
ncbi:hypothetical protein EJ06DRAFT_431544 [Trichodelitschia bisporula]|uniref:Rhodopsin domain-containing protein n=1 Tax=Trichodelitschia bisporula TaxID=703511 RepID=A0A6G1HX21_9PEZI|nr:hypothetical protein EJ06DRAFT_431544 [Trichodelitschia bisporula]